MKAFWWDNRNNLGDVLTPMLVPDLEWAPPAEAEFVGIGSVVEYFDGREVTVWGSGRAGPRAPRTDLSRANVLALRGLLTRALVTHDKAEVFGDPGLLANEFGSKWFGDYTAIVPHWQDQERMRETYPTAVFVDVTGDVGKAINQISGARLVISSSLHGLVIADAFYIPRVWDWFDGVQGDGFKFRDYGTVMGAFDPGQTVSPPPGRIVEVRRELKECLSNHLAQE